MSLLFVFTTLNTYSCKETPIYTHKRYLALFILTASWSIVAKKAPTPISAVSPQTETFIRTVQNELNMWHYAIRIQPLAEENAMVSSGYFTGFSTLSLNEKWFNTFSDETKRFIVGHELIHIQKRHIPKALALSFFWPSPNSIFIPAHLRKKFYYGDVSKTLAMLWYSRIHEKEADLLCAKKLHCAQGGIEFFEALIKEEGKCFRLPDAFATHPSHKKRIKQLRKLMASPNYKTA